MAELVREQDADQGEREGQTGGQIAQVMHDPVEGQYVGVAAERRIAEAEVVHVTHAYSRRREHGDDEQEDRKADALETGLRTPSGFRYGLTEDARRGHFMS